MIIMVKFKYVLIFVFIFIFAFSVVSFASYDIDDRDSSIVYGASSKVSDTGAYLGTLSQLGVNYNMYFTFYGNSIDVIVSRYRNTGDFLVYLDGVLCGTYNVGTTSNGYVNNVVGFSASDLDNSFHTISILPIGTVTDAVSGYSTNSRVFIDKLVISHQPVDSLYQDFLFYTLFLSIGMIALTINIVDFVFRRLNFYD